VTQNNGVGKTGKCRRSVVDDPSASVARGYYRILIMFRALNISYGQ
jgi:hypothetical protein